MVRNCIHRIFLLTLVMLSAAYTFAVSVGAGAAVGYRDGADVCSLNFNGEVSLSIEDLGIWARMAELERIDFSIEYGVRSGNTIEHVFNAHTALFPLVSVRK